LDNRGCARPVQGNGGFALFLYARVCADLHDKDSINLKTIIYEQEERNRYFYPFLLTIASLANESMNKVWSF
jgi:hypothetical protein